MPFLAPNYSKLHTALMSVNSMVPKRQCTWRPPKPEEVVLHRCWMQAGQFLPKRLQATRCLSQQLQATQLEATCTLQTHRMKGHTEMREARERQKEAPKKFEGKGHVMSHKSEGVKGANQGSQTGMTTRGYMQESKTGEVDWQPAGCKHSEAPAAVPGQRASEHPAGSPPPAPGGPRSVGLTHAWGQP